MLAAQIEQLLRQGVEHQRARRFHEAEKIYRHVLAQAPGCADAWNLLGMIALEARQPAQAAQLVRRAIELAPNQPNYYNNLATIAEQLGDLDASVAALEQAIRLNPRFAAAHHNLGEMLKAQGRVGESLASYRRALEIDPYFFTCASSYLMLLNYDPHVTAAQLSAEHVRLGRRWTERLPRAAPHAQSRDSERPLTLGYLSPDFRKHAVARFFEPLLENHDRSRFSVFLYAEIPGEDEVSRRLKARADGWRVTSLLPTAEVIRQVQADRVDILIDLAGHTRHNRLDVLAARPAPLCCTYLGYSNTTGIETVDYRITDAIVDPVDAPLPGPERLVRLPGSFACFLPPTTAPDVSPLPARQAGRITFGSHHPPLKMNDSVLALWRRVLDAVPGSRLLCMRDMLGGQLGERLRRQLAAHGIEGERLVFRSPTIAEPDYLAVFAEIDVVLDTFPFTGHTMSCESLWMGVPIITLRGDRPTGRLTSSVQTALGLAQYIADSPDEYVAIAASQAAGLDELERLRGELRGRMQRSLCDGPRFTQNLEAAYRQMWRTWCARIED